MTEKRIESICTPCFEGHSGDGACVGHRGVTRIKEFQENCGTYGINWYVVYKGEHESARFNALHLESIKYEDDNND